MEDKQLIIKKNIEYPQQDKFKKKAKHSDNCSQRIEKKDKDLYSR